MERIRARARLALRAEKAFGLREMSMTLAPRSAPRPAPPSAVHPADGPKRQPTAAVVAPPVEEQVQPQAAPAVTKRDPRPPFSAEILPREQKITALQNLDENEVRGCTRCRLCEARTHTVFGEGDPDAQIMFIGEGPGENEDLSGRPFVGRAGELLEKMIGGMGLSRERVYIANIVKCRPPNNRAPIADEVATCSPYLERQIEIIRPRVIVTLGLCALQYMIGDQKITMGRSRGRWLEWRGIKLMPTFHPAYVLRNYTDATRAAVWSDLKMVMSEVGLVAPKRGE